MSQKTHANAEQIIKLTVAELARAIAGAAIAETAVHLPPERREECLIHAATLMIGAGDAPELK